MAFRSGEIRQDLQIDKNSSLQLDQGMSDLLREDGLRAAKQQHIEQLEHALFDHLAVGSLPRHLHVRQRPLALVLGLLTSPEEGNRRAYSRTPLSWSVRVQRGEFLYRFVVGELLPRPHSKKTIQLVKQLRAEHALFGDMEFLPNVRDGEKSHLAEKTLGWFLRAVEAFPQAKFYAKADVDTFVVVPRLISFLKRTPGPHVPLLIGHHQWASYTPRTKNICGCCGFTRKMAVRMQTQRGFVPWSCNGTDDAVGPFPFGIGPFFAISQAVGLWLRTSSVVTRATAGLASNKFGGFANYAEEILFGWVVFRVPGIRVFDMGSLGRAVHDIDERGGLMPPLCLQRLGLTHEDLTTGYFHEKGSNEEVTAPSSVAVHHVLSEIAMNRTWAATWHWTRLLKTTRANISCVFEMKEL
tara:strand:+ start:995 stop:2227 length:1233 start_codon:yes stop_codon:yes gene_type:complete